MRKFFVLLPVLLIALLCCCQKEPSCDHQWAPADCLNPKTCTLCSKSEGEALGHDFLAATCNSPEICSHCDAQQGQPLDHDWRSATCTAPETCVFCGSTQGEALPHSFGKWEVNGEEMTRSCTDCTAPETVPLDREVYGLGQATGHWDPYIISDGQSYYWATVLPSDAPTYCVHIGEDGRIRLEDEGEFFEGTLMLVEYSEENATYSFDADFGEDMVLRFVFFELDNVKQLLVVLDNQYVFFSQHEILSSYVQGTWVTADGGIIRKLTLLEDETFDYNGEFSGNWHIRYEISDNTHCYTVMLHHFRDGEPITDYFYASTSINSNDPLEAILSLPYSPNAGLYVDGDYLNIFKMDPEEIAQLESTMAEGQKKLIGTWCSQTVGKYIHNDTHTVEQINTGYSITFREDGTFTANLDKEKTGVWTFREAINHGTGIGCAYDLVYDDPQAVTNLSAQLTQDNMLTLFETYNGYSVSYNFRMQNDTTPEEAVNIICGDWTLSNAHTYSSATGKMEDLSVTGYSLTFREDGTVSGFMEGAKEGKWVYMTKESLDHDNGQAEIYYTYNVQFDGNEECFSILFDERSLRVSKSAGVKSTTWFFQKATAN